MSHHRRTVTAIGAPAALGPYSHGVISNGLLFCSGQTPLDPESGELVGGSIGDQTRRCMESLAAICSSAGAELADAVRCTIYLTSMDDFAAVNEAYGAFFPGEPPARVTFAAAGLPVGAAVEIDAIVAMPD